jgi:hypothetical protein
MQSLFFAETKEEANRRARLAELQAERAALETLALSTSTTCVELVQGYFRAYVGISEQIWDLLFGENHKYFKQRVNRDTFVAGVYARPTEHLALARGDFRALMDLDTKSTSAGFAAILNFAK